MVRWAFIIAVVAALSSGLPPRPARGARLDNSCVECHRQTDTIRALPPWRQEQFLHWYGSVHGRDDVTCDKCHGGDPARVAKDLAHQGVLPSNDPNSRIYYKNLPETCGTCHEAVYQDFTRSEHYADLKADRLAPACTTCHGFQMDIATVEPARIAERCLICHNTKDGVKPSVARRAQHLLEGLRSLRERIKRAQVALDLAEQDGVAPTGAADSLKRVRQRLAKTGALWHRFDLQSFERELEDVGNQADGVYGAARRALTGKK